MKSKVLRIVAMVAGLSFASMLGAQNGEPDERRVNEILYYLDRRVNTESDASADVGDYPKSIQLLRMRSRLVPQSEDILTTLTWMLGNIHYRGESISEAIRFMEANPDNPDRGFPLAQLYYEMKLFAKVPAVLEEDILRDPPPHANTFRMIGHSYRKMGFHEDALRVWETYLKHDPDDLVIQLQRDKALAQIRDKK